MIQTSMNKNLKKINYIILGIVISLYLIVTPISVNPNYNYALNFILIISIIMRYEYLALPLPVDKNIVYYVLLAERYGVG